MPTIDEKKQCENCSKKISTKSTYCHKCGFKQSENSSAPKFQVQCETMESSDINKLTRTLLDLCLKCLRFFKTILVIVIFEKCQNCHKKISIETAYCPKYCPECGFKQHTLPEPIIKTEKPCTSCGETIKLEASICPKCNGVQSNYKNKMVAGFLALFLGALGLHKFYLNQAGWGILYLLFCWTFIPGIISFFEALSIFSMSDREFLNSLL